MHIKILAQNGAVAYEGDVYLQALNILKAFSAVGERRFFSVEITGVNKWIPENLIDNVKAGIIEYRQCDLDNTRPHEWFGGWESIESMTHDQLFAEYEISCGYDTTDELLLILEAEKAIITELLT